jgi:hypothetical protein
MTNTGTLNPVERACAELLRNGQAVTLTAVAAGIRHLVPTARVIIRARPPALGSGPDASRPFRAPICG